VVAEARSCGRRQLAVSEVAIFNDEGTLYAKGARSALRPNGASGDR
jgi:hypothetical protein